ncbi:MAG: hypothetical protein KBT88_15350 [Gammaproteobacteria bacterium]|nr:hypothetical protein [Gammaproteobacteria bacterium]MBQ0841156.1 hypothetical protein [Gammaproteobacteria bacterium]
MFDTAMMLWALLFGSIGFAYFIYGKRQDHTVARYTGIALIIYPYFVANVFALVVVGIILMSLPRFFGRQ